MLFQISKRIKIISKIRLKANGKLTNLKNKLGIFKKKVDEEKKRPKSKLKSYLLGFGTVLSIFGVTFFTSTLPANAKDGPTPVQTPGQGAPAPGQVPPARGKPSEEIIGGLSGAAATVCALAVSSGSFLIGAACGVVVVVGILKSQGK